MKDHYPKFKTKIGKESFTMNGAFNWNLIPQNIREMSPIGYFKKSVREWIVENIPKFVE